MPRGRLQWVQLAFLVALLTLALWHAAQWRFVCDDAYIALRYAKNWVEHGVAGYNAQLGPGVQGFTSPLWVLLLAVGQWVVGAGAVATALVLNALGAAGLACCAAGLSFRCAPAGTRSWAALFCLAALALCPEFMVWSSGGLETSVSAALGLGALWALLVKRWSWFHALAALAACTRLDTLVWILPVWLLLHPRDLRVALLRPATLFWGLPLFSLLLSYLIYGSWLPQTFAVKAGGFELARRFGWAYLEQWLFGAGMGIGLLMLFLQPKKNLPWIASVLALMSYVFWVGGDFMGYSRFFLPATVLVISLASASLARVAAMPVPIASRCAVLSAVVAIGLLAIKVSPRLQKDRQEDWLDKRYESVHAMERFAAIRVAAGKAYAQRWPAATRVTVGAAGAFAFASGLTVFDAYGLTDPTVMHLGHAQPKGRPGHRFVGGRKWAKAHRPHLRCELGWVGSPGFPTKQALAARKPLTQGAGWTCRATGPIALRGAKEPLPSHHYCCIRERFPALEAEAPADPPG